MQESNNTEGQAGEVGAAPENVVPMRRTLQEKMLDKKVKKQQQKREERKKFLLSKGVPDQVADQIIAQEEFNNLPIDQKVALFGQELGRLQGSISQAMRQMAQEMVALRQNQEVIADSFDVNLRMLERILVRLGIDEETQKKVLDEVSKEFFEEKKRQAEERAKQEAAASEPQKEEAKTEQQLVEEELKAAQSESAGIVTAKS